MLTEPLERAWHVTSHLMGVRNSDELRVYEPQPQMVQFFSTIGQSEATYRALKALRDSEAWIDLSAAQKRMVEKEELGMKLSGIGLEGADKERFNVIQMELAELATGFSNSVLGSRKAYELIITESSDVEGFRTSGR